MIFQPDAVTLIRDKRKTQTRRPVKHNREFGYEMPGRYLPDRVYSVQPGRGKRAVCQLTVTEVRKERLGDITLDDIRREGFKFPGEFWQRWEQLHRHANHETVVWVISFVLGDQRDAPRLLRAGEPSVPICARCHRGLADHDYVTGTRINACPHCGLARPTERDDDHGYTTQPSLAITGEAEALTDHQLALYTNEARVRDRQRAGKPVEASVQRMQAELEQLRQHVGNGSVTAKRIAAIERLLHNMKAAA